MTIPGFRKHQESKGLLHGVIMFLKLQTVNPHVTRNNLMISSPKQKCIEDFSDIREKSRVTHISLHIQHNVEHIFDDAICK
jgi:hypothetical protein